MDIDRLLSSDPTYATTNANSSEAFSMESVRAAYQKMKDMRPVLSIEGKKIGHISGVVVSDSGVMDYVKRIDSVEVRSFGLSAIPIYVDASIPKTWVPPESGSPHFSYGPEDEEWMRPLGLGKLVPTIVAFNSSVYDQLLKSLCVPESIYGQGDSNYSSAMMDRSFLWNY